MFAARRAGAAAEPTLVVADLTSVLAAPRPRVARQGGICETQEAAQTAYDMTRDERRYRTQKIALRRWEEFDRHAGRLYLWPPDPTLSFGGVGRFRK